MSSIKFFLVKCVCSCLLLCLPVHLLFFLTTLQPRGCIIFPPISQIFPFNVNCLWPLLPSARSTVIVWPMSHTLSSDFHCNGPVSSTIWPPYPWLLCRSYARAGWPSVTLVSWRVEPRDTGLSSLPRACPGSRMMRWGIHSHNHAWNKLMNPSHVIWAIL